MAIVNTRWLDGSIACHQFTGVCSLMLGYDYSGGGDYTYNGINVPPRNWGLLVSSGIAMKGAKFNGWGATDEPGIGTRISTSVRWTPSPVPAGDCNWSGKFCCDPFRTGWGMCDTSLDPFVFCRQESGLCATQ